MYYNHYTIILYYYDLFLSTKITCVFLHSQIMDTITSMPFNTSLTLLLKIDCHLENKLKLANKDLNNMMVVYN